MSRFLVPALVFLFAVIGLGAQAQEWPVYGADAAGTRYSSAAQINRKNVQSLAPVWTYHTGEAERRGEAFKRSAFEATPILVDGKLLFCTPFDRVVALDAATGRELWTFDPGLPAQLHPPNGFICRGVALWRDSQAKAGEACAARVFLGTNDSRLLALDLATGLPCTAFGERGVMRLKPDIAPLYPGEVQVDAPPTVMGDMVIVGSGADDMSQARAPSGTVRVFNARNGAPLWSFDPVPRSPADPGAASWQGSSFVRSSGGNVWVPMTVDAARDLLFVATAGPSASFWGGERPGDNLFTSSVVALRGSTGAVVWYFQNVHHDVWDYDVAAQPTLTTVQRRGHAIPAIVIGAKTGFVFVLNRETGEPLFPIEERPVPQSDVTGEHTSATQPEPLAPPPLDPQLLRSQDAFGVALFDRWSCQRKIAAARSEGLFTPPSLRGSIIFPFTGGGVNWGGGAVDPTRGLFIVNSNNLAHLVRLIPRADYAAQRAAHPKVEIGRELGTPYAASRELLVSPLGIPCNKPPWGTLAAVDLNAGTIRWEVPLGAMGWGFIRGTPNLGGPIVTAGGLVFIAAAMDDRLRAFDVDTGAELWSAGLPAGGQATPMTYTVQGRQFVVVCAGGHFRLGTKLGDAVVAFSLPAAPP